MAQETMESSSRDSIATDETDRLIASKKVEGTPVFNRQGKRLGIVDSFMVDKFSGQVAYAVMAFNTVLGTEEHHHPLPWKVLTYDSAVGGYVIDLEEDKLQGAPSFRTGSEPDWSNQDFGRHIHDFYDVPLYWGAH
jgi:hypothetical protein